MPTSAAGRLGARAGSYVVAGPNWQGQTPAGTTLIRAETQFAPVVFRTQLFNPADLPNVMKVQSGYKAQPLSAYLHQAAPPAAPAIDFPKIDNEMVKTGFFQYLDFALQFIPATPDEADIRAKLARIGIGPGKTFDFKDLSAEHKAAVVLGMKAGEDKIAAKGAELGKNQNGWLVAGAGGNRAYYAGDWLKRAAIAKAGIYANDPIEAMYPMTRKDVNGEALDGSKHNYSLTFAKGQYPPANAFWSVTMYDGKSQLLIENPISRYLINSPMLPAMTKNRDGSLTIYIQSKSPGKDKEANWLPAPDGPIYMVMRLYWPKTDAPSILPPGEGSWSATGGRAGPVRFGRHASVGTGAFASRAASLRYFCGFFGRCQPSTVTCRARATVSLPAGTLAVTVEPAATVAPAPTVMGATMSCCCRCARHPRSPCDVCWHHRSWR